MRNFKQMAWLARDPRPTLCLASFLLYIAVLEECGFCLYLRTPWSVASILIVGSLLLWLGRPGHVLNVVVSSLVFCLAAFNVFKEREYAMADYGPDWGYIAFQRSWGYLLLLLLATVVCWYAVAVLRRRTL